VRILAIRGKDLASLAGRFAVELESDPLASAGLFAITGPTGAGKSTLLDALCVALFDKTPRLHVRGGVPIGRADEDESMRLPANDVRNLLRRGAGSGYAEVDFVGRDGRRYRARWSVHRARNRPEGRLQAQSVVLEDLDTGEVVGGTKSETLDAIEARLGLTFDQFRRSALLAQGDFAAFLRANGGQRAELLERMTGTEIYGAVSMAAYRRHAEEKQRLEALHESIGRHAVLDDEEREALEKSRAAAAAGVESAVTSLRASEKAVGWHQRAAALGEATEAAEARVRAGVQAWEESAADRIELAGVVAAQEKRAAVQLADRAAAALDAATASATKLGEERDARRAEAAEWGAQLERVEREMAVARRQLYARLEARVADVESRRQRANQWIDAHPEIAHLAADWSRWESALERLAEAETRRGLVDARRPALLEASRAARRALAEAASERKKAVGALEKARLESDKVDRAAADKPLEQVRRRIDDAVGQLDQLRRLARAAEDAVEAAARRDTARQNKSAAEERITAARARCNALTIEVAAATARSREAERMLDQMRLAQNLDSHRGGLVDGEPCPLCGAEEHPWAADASPIDNLVSEQTQRLELLRTQASELGGRRAEHVEVARTAEREVEAAEVEAAKAVEVIEEATGRWRVGLAELGELPLLHDPADGRTTAWVRTRLARAEARLEELRVEEVESQKLDEAARQAAGRVRARQSDLEQANESHRQADRVAAKARDALARAESDREAAELDAEQARSILRGAFDGADLDVAPVLADPEKARADYTRRVSTYEEHRSTVSECERALAGLRVELETAREQLEEIGGDGAKEILAADQREPAVIRKHIEELRGWLADALESSGKAEAAAVEAGARASAATAEVEARRKEAEQTAAGVAEAARQLGIEVDELRARLARDEEWIEHRKQRFKAMETDVANWKAVLEERKENLAAHLGSDAPDRCRRGRGPGGRVRGHRGRSPRASRRAGAQAPRRRRGAQAALGPGRAHRPATG
jgi:exonuclease SbcC